MPAKSKKATQVPQGPAYPPETLARLSPDGRRLLLRTSDADGRAWGGFQYPTSGPVEAPDWDARPRCGGGLHGLLWGEGAGDLLNWSPDARWQVLAVDAGTPMVDLGGDKVKVQRAEVVYSGDRTNAVLLMVERGAVAGMCVGSTLTGGYRSTLTGGDGSTLTGGDGSTLTGGYRSTLTGGDGSTLTGGDGSTLTGGDGSTLTGGYRSTLIFSWYDSKASRRRVVAACVGENGIEPGTAYVVRDGVVVKAEVK